jgi:HEAT repeat protein
VGVFFFRSRPEAPLEHTLHMLNSPLGTDRQAAIANLAGFPEKQSVWLPSVIERLRDPDAVVRRNAVELLVHLREKSAMPAILGLLDDESDDVQRAVIVAARKMGDVHSAARLLARAGVEDDPEMQTALLTTALELGEPGAIPRLIEVVRGGGLLADDAFDALRGHVQVEASRDNPRRLERWWQENKRRLVWEESSGMFVVRPVK